MQPDDGLLRTLRARGDEVDPQDGAGAGEEPPGDVPLVRGGSIEDPLGIVHLILSYVENLDGEPMFIGTTCAPGSSYIGRHGKASRSPPTCLACALGVEDATYTKDLLETVEGVTFVKRPTGGLQLMKATP